MFFCDVGDGIWVFKHVRESVLPLSYVSALFIKKKKILLYGKNKTRQNNRIGGAGLGLQLSAFLACMRP